MLSELWLSSRNSSQYLNPSYVKPWSVYPLEKTTGRCGCEYSTFFLIHLTSITLGVFVPGSDKPFWENWDKDIFLSVCKLQVLCIFRFIFKISDITKKYRISCTSFPVCFVVINWQIYICHKLFRCPITCYVRKKTDGLSTLGSSLILISAPSLYSCRKFGFVKSYIRKIIKWRNVTSKWSIMIDSAPRNREI